MTDELHNLRPLAKWVRHGSIRIEDPTVRVRLDRYLAGRFRYRSRTQWAKVIEAGRILLNGQVCRPSRVIGLGDRIDYVPLRQVEPPVNVIIPVLYEDDLVLAVNKPPNLPVHPSGRYFKNTLLCLLLEARGQTLDNPGLRIVHRLDRETSGVLLFGKTKEATSYLAGQFEDRSVIKEYLALVYGAPEPARFRVDAALGPNPASRVRKAVGVVPIGQGRRAVTDFEVAARGPAHALLLARPRTGRLHQIRVHARHAGFPIVGDKLYGLDEEFFLKLASGGTYTREDRERLILDRQGLHAARITCQHPGTGQSITCAAPLADDMKAACSLLQVILPA
jgi:23S rRNA pseudouridine1911/1915/1917 synthase